MADAEVSACGRYGHERPTAITGSQLAGPVSPRRERRLRRGLEWRCAQTRGVNINRRCSRIGGRREQKNVNAHGFGRGGQYGLDHHRCLKRALDEAYQIAFAFLLRVGRLTLSIHRHDDNKAKSIANAGVESEVRERGRLVVTPGALERFPPLRLGREIDAEHRRRLGFFGRVEYREILIPLWRWSQTAVGTQTHGLDVIAWYAVVDGGALACRALCVRYAGDPADALDGCLVAKGPLREDLELSPADLVTRGLKQGAQGDKSAQILVDSVLQKPGLVLGDGVKLPNPNSILPSRNEQPGADGKGRADDGGHKHWQEVLGSVPPLPSEHFLCSRHGKRLQAKYMVKI